MRKLALSALATAALCLPAAAQAGTSTTTSTASFAVADQCTVTGATVNLGTFRADQTWGDVGNAVGANRDGLVLNRNAGVAYLTFGSVTCSNGVPYTLVARGNKFSGMNMTFTVNGYEARFSPFIKTLGAWLFLIPEPAPMLSTAACSATTFRAWAPGLHNPWWAA
jgi:hypothetical protein